MRSSCEVTALILAENRQGVVDIGRLFGSRLPQSTLIKKFHTAENLVAVTGFSNVMLNFFFHNRERCAQGFGGET